MSRLRVAGIVRSDLSHSLFFAVLDRRQCLWVFDEDVPGIHFEKTFGLKPA